MPKTLFLEIDVFDEGFINGYEDVDLYAKLRNKDYRFTINPESLMFHYESRTGGGNAHESSNSLKLEQGTLKSFFPDWQQKIKEDGLVPDVTPFGILRADYPPQLVNELNLRLDRMPPAALLTAIKRYPLWEKSWREALSQTCDLLKR